MGLGVKSQLLYVVRSNHELIWCRWFIQGQTRCPKTNIEVYDVQVSRINATSST